MLVQTPRPLFELASGAPLTHNTLTPHLHSLLQSQGLNEKLYALHSFRNKKAQQDCLHGLLKHWDVGLQTVMKGTFLPHAVYSFFHPDYRARLFCPTLTRKREISAPQGKATSQKKEAYSNLPLPLR